jgi:AcrR family transcriptional regulator
MVSTDRQPRRSAGRAPERHFPNRQALLDALSERGFVMLAEAIRHALAEHDDELPNRFRATAAAYVGFALNNPALLELMSASKTDSADGAIAVAADTAGMTVNSLRLVVVAALQAIANLAATHRIRPEEVDDVIDQAVAVFIRVLTLRRRPLVDN